MNRLVWIYIATSLTACGGGECESTLRLTDADRGTRHLLDLSCTSLTIALEEPAASDQAWLEAPTVSDPTVLRFDYRMVQDGTVNYFFTPLEYGQSSVAIDAWSTTEVVDTWDASFVVCDAPCR